MNKELKKGNSYLEILFTDRNKDYGSYELRKNYGTRLRNGLITTIAVLCIIISTNFVSDADDNKGITKPIGPPRLDTIKVIMHPEIIKKPIVKTNANPPKTSAPIKAPNTSPPTAIAPDNFVQTPITAITTATGTTSEATPIGTQGSNIPSHSGTSTASGGGTSTATIPSTGNGIAVANAVDQLPSYPGGENALRNFLTNNLEFPELAREKGIESKVEINFVVMEDGTIQQIISDKNDEYGFSKEGIRVVGKMPKWKPAIIAGKPVKCYFSVPISFVLDDAN